MKKMYKVVIYKKDNKSESITLDFSNISDAFILQEVILKFSDYSCEITKISVQCEEA